MWPPPLTEVADTGAVRTQAPVDVPVGGPTRLHVVYRDQPDTMPQAVQNDP